MGVLFFLSIVSLQLVGPLIASTDINPNLERYSCGRNSLRRKSRRPRPWLPLRLPRRPRVSIGPLCFLFYDWQSMELRFCGCLIFVCAGNIMARNLSQIAASKASSGERLVAFHPGWNLGGLPETRNRGLTE